MLGSDSLHIRTVDACNSKTFKGCLWEMLLIYPKILLILDNTSYHKSDTLTKFVKANEGRLRLVFLPAYTPQLNPIGQQWNVLRMMLAGGYFASVEDLRAAIAAIARRHRMRPIEMMYYLVAAQ